MNRKILAATIFSAVAFFVVLGMRIPCLNQNGVPKQRPRAVIETTSPTSPENIQKQSLETELAPPVTIVSSVVWAAAPGETCFGVPSIVTPRLSARAPPCASLTNC